MKYLWWKVMICRVLETNLRGQAVANIPERWHSLLRVDKNVQKRSKVSHKVIWEWNENRSDKFLGREV